MRIIYIILLLSSGKIQANNPDTLCDYGVTSTRTPLHISIRVSDFIGEFGMNKKCSKCGVVKPTDGYYFGSGYKDNYMNICKECCNKQANKRHHKNMIENNIVCKNCENNVRWGKEFCSRKCAKEYTFKQKSVDIKVKQKANYLVKVAIKSGDLIMDNCVRCGKEKTKAHHEDYGKPLDVIWFCDSCHKIRHYEMSREVRNEAS